MHAFHSEGMDYAMLEVKVDNETALKLYTRFGFERVARLSVYSKPAQL
jgi:ribosomal protein S18 acetylase RimI-like enzyme